MNIVRENRDRALLNRRWMPQNVLILFNSCVNLVTGLDISKNISA